MAWDWLKRLLGIRPRPESDGARGTRAGAPAPSAPSTGGELAKLPEVGWLPEAENSFGVPVLDVRAVTCGLLSMTQNPQCAENLASFRREDGRCFADAEPGGAGPFTVKLRYRIDRVLADGPLFLPREMEHKWALFHYRGRILCVRSWTREVQLVAEVTQDGEYATLTSLRGPLLDGHEPARAARLVDFLIRSHALDMIWPAPLEPGMTNDPKVAAMLCMSMFGNRAWFATEHELPPHEPEKPLRADSLLHIAVARGDRSAVLAQLAAGLPIELRARDGLTPLHWALAREDTSLLELLLEQGCPVDARSEEESTPLMNAVQLRSLSHSRFLLTRGADPNAKDQRGFTALHRAAEMGERELVELLLHSGADPTSDAQGHTPRSLAQKSGEAAIVALLESKQTGGVR